MIAGPTARKSRLVGYLAVFVVSSVITCLILELWKGDLRIPFQYGFGDSLGVEIVPKALTENAWMFHNPRLAMPFGMDMSAIPLPDTISFLLMKLIAIATRQFGLVLNIYFLLTFPLTAICTLYLLRVLRIGWACAIFGSLLFTFLPYHFLRGEAHLYMSTYYMVPGVVLIAFRLLGEKLPFLSPGNGKFARLQIRGRESAEAFVACVVIASIGTGYYGFFACALLSVAGIAAVRSTRSWLPGLSAFLCIALILLTTFADLIPYYLHSFKGQPGIAFDRSASEAEIYGLKIAQMLLPITNHRLPALAALKARYNAAPLVDENDTTTLGIVMAIGFLILLTWVFLRLFERKVNWLSREDQHLIDLSSVLCLTATLLGTIGGFGAIVALLLSPQVRGYNRIVVYIACLAVVTLALLVDRLIARRISTSIGQVAFALGLTVVLAVALLDQTSRSFVPQYAVIERSFRADERFVNRLETAFPRSAAIFQMPYMAFPEVPGTAMMGPYDLAVGYLHSNSLRWSYGAVKGTWADVWQQTVTAQPTAKMIEILALWGFAGIYIDRQGYADMGARVEREIRPIIDSSPVISASGRLAVFDLKDYVARLRGGLSATEWQERRDVVTPILVKYGAGFQDQGAGEAVAQHWSRQTGEIHILNLSSRAIAVKLQSILSTDISDLHSLQVSGPLLQTEVPIVAKQEQITAGITVPKGESVLRFHAGGRARLNSSDKDSSRIFSVERLELIRR